MNKLTAKQEIIDEVFEKSIEKLCKLSKDRVFKICKKYNFINNLVVKQTLILNETGLKIC